MATFVFHSMNTAQPGQHGFGPMIAELEKRGHRTLVVCSPYNSDTPHQDRADAIVEALKDVDDDVVVVGISNQGCILPLVAAKRPVRRLVYVNAMVPRPGKPFIDVLKSEPVFAPGLLEATLASLNGMTDEFLDIVMDPNLSEQEKRDYKERARKSGAKSKASGMFERCQLTELPNVDNVYISAEFDQSVQPQWQQMAARTHLGIEPVIVRGATHGAIFNSHTKEVADACTEGL